MIQVVCGEDAASSRSYVVSQKKAYRSKGYHVQDIVPAQIYDVQKEGEHAAGLFEQKRVFFVQGLCPYLARSRKMTKTLQELQDRDDLEIIDWEDGASTYELGIKKKEIVKEFKAAASVFQLLDLLVPGKKKKFIETLTLLRNSQEEMFIYVMVTRHMRGILLAKYGNLPGRIAPWQKTKLLSQARSWKEDKIIGFYEALAKIDHALKTSTTPFSLGSSLEILALYYL